MPKTRMSLRPCAIVATRRHRRRNRPNDNRRIPLLYMISYGAQVKSRSDGSRHASHHHARHLRARCLRKALRAHRGLARRGGGVPARQPRAGSLFYAVANLRITARTARIDHARQDAQRNPRVAPTRRRRPARGRSRHRTRLRHGLRLPLPARLDRASLFVYSPAIRAVRRGRRRPRPRSGLGRTPSSRARSTRSSST